MNTKSVNNTNSCGKVAYNSAIEAHLALEAIQHNSKTRDRTPTYYYRCSKCKKYHLTSQINKGFKYDANKRGKYRNKKK